MNKYFKYLRRKLNQAKALFIIKAELKRKGKINVGSSSVPFDNDWFSCDIDILDITQKANWFKLLGFSKVTNIFAEHVWEHLNESDTYLANKNCYHFLKKNGRLRLAVPDGYHPDKTYIDYVKPNGTGLGADDHKILYNYSIMKKKLEQVGFTVHLLEYWDENGKFHYVDWSNDHGKVTRSRRYDSRNIDGTLNYTSLIVDAIK